MRRPASSNPRFMIHGPRATLVAYNPHTRRSRTVRQPSPSSQVANEALDRLKRTSGLHSLADISGIQDRRDDRGKTIQT
mgnify:CR=1 FL=1